MGFFQFFAVRSQIWKITGERSLLSERERESSRSKCSTTENKERYSGAVILTASTASEKIDLETITCLRRNVPVSLHVIFKAASNFSYFAFIADPMLQKKRFFFIEKSC